jgi:hypothetical protein
MAQQCEHFQRFSRVNIIINRLLSDNQIVLKILVLVKDKGKQMFVNCMSYDIEYNSFDNRMRLIRHIS